MLLRLVCGKTAIMKKEISPHENKRSASGLNTLASETLPLLRRILGKQGLASADILAFWDQIAGEELAACTVPEKISFKPGERNGGILHIAVPNGAFALEIQHREKFILDKVNAYFGYGAVTGMKIRQGSVPLLRKAKQFNQPPLKKILVSREEQNFIEELTGGVEDDRLKESLVRLGKNIIVENRK